MTDQTRILVALIVEDACLAVVVIALYMTNHTTAGGFTLFGLIMNTCATDTFKALRTPPPQSERT